MIEQGGLSSSPILMDDLIISAPRGGRISPTASTGFGSGLSLFSGGMDILAGALGFMAAGETAGIAGSRARLLRLEAEADAQRYQEVAASFQASQIAGYVKSGVQLSGSPLDVLAETARVSSENLSALRAQGDAQALDLENQAAESRAQGRALLTQGLTRAGTTFAKESYRQKEIRRLKEPRNNTPIPIRGYGG